VILGASLQLTNDTGNSMTLNIGNDTGGNPTFVVGRNSGGGVNYRVNDSPDGAEADIINLRSGILDLTGGPVNFGNQANPSDQFNFIGGTLKDVGTFYGDLDQRRGTFVPGASIGTTTVMGRYDVGNGVGSGDAIWDFELDPSTDVPDIVEDPEFNERAADSVVVSDVLTIFNDSELWLTWVDGEGQLIPGLGDGNDPDGPYFKSAFIIASYGSFVDGEGDPIDSDAFGFGNVPMVNTTFGWVADLGPSGANLTPDGWYLDCNYNDQNLIAVVPEPTSLVLLSLGLVAVAIASMRRRTHRTANPDDSWRA